VTDLLRRLEAARAEGRKLLVPYLVAGAPDAAAYLTALGEVSAHADAIEVGLPFSDPLMDGPVIAAAAERALANGIGPLSALELAGPPLALDPPRLAMTYYNPIHSVGEQAFCRRARAAGIAGLIVPDLPFEESSSLRAAAADVGLAWTPLVAPTSSPERIARISEGATGFVYAVSTLGVTGARESLSERARPVVERCRQATDIPVLVGIGITTPEQAVEAAEVADGVVVGTAVVARIMEEGPGAAAGFLSGVRAALDAAAGLRAT
jgi:tryptophan synthase alpha chain